MPDPLVEICVPDLPSALEAAAGGADRVELCADMTSGGVTPGAGSIAETCRRLAIPVHILIRPRAGGFLYDDAEYTAMREDIAAARDRGASGVVLGMLREDRTIDEDRVRLLVAEARPMSVTFHRAFDLVPDPEEAIETLVRLGIDRVLTSGGSPRAVDALDRLALYVRLSSGRLAILAGGGVAAEHVGAILATGVREVHAGSSVMTPGKPAPGSAWPEPARTRADRVRELVAATRSGGTDS